MFLKVVSTNSTFVAVNQRIRIFNVEQLGGERMVRVVVLEEAPSLVEPQSFFLHDHTVGFYGSGEDCRLEVKGYRMAPNGGAFQHIRLLLDLCGTLE